LGIKGTASVVVAVNIVVNTPIALPGTVDVIIIGIVVIEVVVEATTVDVVVGVVM
jgi:hypothetical protein